MRWLASLLTCSLIAACASSPTSKAPAIPEEPLTLPEPDATLEIAGLGPCNDDPDRRLRLSSRHALTVLVHGCLGSAGGFRALSRVLAFHGQQSACFSYDDRDSMMRSSRRLANAVEALATQLDAPQITIIGHSQGGLIARKALVTERDDPIESPGRLRLVTVSAPFSGIRSARFCAIPLLRVATLWFHDLACWFVSGDKWYEITAASDFIRKPGTLDPAVERYLLVTTDERGSCREHDDSGQCIADDFVFTLAEQELPSPNTGSIARLVEVRAGHVEIVGESGVAPRKLIRVLQQEGYVAPTQPSRAARFDALLTRLYGADAPGPAR